MEMHRNVYVGVLAILLGLIVIIFPLISVATLSILSGIGIIFLGIWLLFQGYKNWGKNLAAGIASLILAFFAFAIGIVFIGDIPALSFVTFLALYIVGFFLIITGLTALFSEKGVKAKGIGILGVIFGLLFMIMGIYVGNPFFLAIILGAFLIIVGIMEIFILPPENPTV
jgi:membrane protein HdeD